MLLPAYLSQPILYNRIELRKYGCSYYWEKEPGSTMKVGKSFVILLVHFEEFVVILYSLLALL